MIEHRHGFAPYVKRPVRDAGTWRPRGWAIKAYGITARTDGVEVPDPGTLARAEAHAAGTIFNRLPRENEHGLGFAIVHEGLLGTWLIVDWWANEIHLYHRLFRSGGDAFEPVEDGLMACTWELAVIAFERDAWLRTMVAREGGPDVDAYLGERLTGSF